MTKTFESLRASDFHAMKQAERRRDLPPSWGLSLAALVTFQGPQAPERQGRGPGVPEERHERSLWIATAQHPTQDSVSGPATIPRVFQVPFHTVTGPCPKSQPFKGPGS